MSTQTIPTTTSTGTQITFVDMKLEVVVLPVADAERSKVFYESLGWRLDADFVFSETSRILQFTPPGSDASIIFGTGVSSATPGSLSGQEVRSRLPGRVTGASFKDGGDLAEAVRRAAEPRGEHEARNGGEYDDEWPDWYAAYMVAEQSGEELPQ